MAVNMAWLASLDAAVTLLLWHGRRSKTKSGCSLSPFAASCPWPGHQLLSGVSFCLPLCCSSLPVDLDVVYLHEWTLLTPSRTQPAVSSCFVMPGAPPLWPRRPSSSDQLS